jgi:ElaB/YqjD/DUF883 family membrane-anchored ribosome-binding protein
MNTSNMNNPDAAAADRVAADTAAAAERLRHSAHEHIDTVAEAVHPVVDRLTDAAHKTVEKVSGVASHAAQAVGVKTVELHQLQDRLVEDCREYVRAHPLQALGCAAAVGFLLTRLIRT